MYSLLLALVWISALLGLALPIAVAVARRWLAYTVWLLALFASLLINLALWSYLAHLLVEPLPYKIGLFGLRLLFYNMAGFLLLFFIYHATNLWQPWYTVPCIVLTALLATAHLPLFLASPEAFRVVSFPALGRTWTAIDPTIPTPGEFWRTVLFWPTAAFMLADILIRTRRTFLTMVLTRSSWAAGGLIVLLGFGLWVSQILSRIFFPLPIVLPMAFLWVVELPALWALLSAQVGGITLPRLQLLLNMANTGILVMTWPQRQWVWWNAAIRKWFKANEHDPNLPEAVQHALTSLLERPGKRETLYLEMPEPRYLEIQVVDLPETNPVAKAVVLWDFTEDARAQQRMERQYRLSSLRSRWLEEALHTEDPENLARTLISTILEHAWEELPVQAAAVYWTPQTFTTSESPTPARPTLLAGIPEEHNWPSTLDLSAPASALKAVFPEHETAVLPFTWTTTAQAGALVLVTERPMAPTLWAEILQEWPPLLGFLLHLSEERALQKQLENVAMAVPIPFLIAQPDGTPLFTNPAFQALMGDPTKAKAPGLDLVLGSGIWENIRQALASGQDTWESIERLEREDRFAFYWVNAFPFRDAQGNIISIGVLLTDFTDQALLREELEQHKWLLDRLMHAALRMWRYLESLHRLLHEVVTLLHEWYPDGHVSLMLFEEDARGQWYVAVRIDDRGQIVPPGPFYRQALLRSAVGWALRHQESLIIADTQNDERWTGQELPDFPARSAIVAPLFQHHRPLGVLVMGWKQPHVPSAADRNLLDSLAQWLALALHNTYLYERFVQRQRQYREQTAKLERLSRHLSLMFTSLEENLQTALQTLYRTLDFLEGRLQDTPRVRRALHALRQDASEIETLAQRYLDVEQLRQERWVPPSTFAVQGLLDEIRNMVAPLLERYQATLQTEVHPPALEITQDRQRLRQVLLALTEVAIRRAQNGTVQIRALFDPESRPQGVVFWVMDTGPTLSRNQAETLFQPSAEWGPITSHPLAFRGQSLDLSFVPETVQHHLRGQIQVREVLGYGLAFWIWVPQTLRGE